jgi:hypothetical protein
MEHRTPGITLLAIVCFCSAALLLAITGTALTHPDLLLRSHFIDPTLPPNIRALRAARLAAFAPLMAGFSIAIGIGLLSRKNWARWTLLLITGIGLGRRLIGLILLPIVAPDIKFQLTPAFGFSVLINAATLCYLIQPKVRQAFGEQD